MIQQGATSAKVNTRYWSVSTLGAENNRQQSHAHVHAILRLTEVRRPLIRVEVRAVIHNQTLQEYLLWSK